MQATIFFGKAYTIAKPFDSHNFKHSIFISSLLINPIDNYKLHIKINILKAPYRFIHHVVTRVLLSRKNNYKNILKEDVVIMCLLTHNIQTNWAYGVMCHMMEFKRNNSTWLPYGHLITQILSDVNVIFEREISNPDLAQIGKDSLNKIKIWVVNEDLKYEPLRLKNNDQDFFQDPSIEAMPSSILSNSQENSTVL